MYHDLGQVTLKSKEKVSLGMVQGPDETWIERICDLLSHKGFPWNWQNREMLSRDLGLDACFFLLHRGGIPFAHVMNVTLDGVGIFGHVFTAENDRRKGAMSHLISAQMSYFRDHRGKALFLGTGYDSAAYHIYRSFGFQGIEEGSGKMDYFTENRDAFYQEYFRPGHGVLENLNWKHWPTSCALFMGDFPGTVRFMPVRLLGRQSTEGPLLPLIQEEQERENRGDSPRVKVARHDESRAVLGVAAWCDHPLWPGTILLDVYCHPAFWSMGDRLMRVLTWPQDRLVMVYADASCPQKTHLLSTLGFKESALLRARCKDRPMHGRPVDVSVWERFP